MTTYVNISCSRALLALALMLLSCTPPSASSSKPAKKTADGPSGGKRADAIDPAEQKELERLLEEAKAAMEARDWVSAKQLIGSGLGKTSENRDLDMFEARFLLLKGEVALENSDQINARRYFTDAMAIFHVRKNDAGRFETFMALGRLEARSGDYAAADRQFQEAKSLESKVTDKVLRGRFLVVQGHLAARQMDHKKAADAYTEALLIFDAIKNNRLRAETLLLLAQEEEMLGRLGSSKQSLHRAAKLFEEAKDLDGKARSVHRLATYAEREKQYATARRLYTDVLNLYRELDNQTAATNVARHLSALPMPDKDKKKKK